MEKQILKRATTSYGMAGTAGSRLGGGAVIAIIRGMYSHPAWSEIHGGRVKDKTIMPEAVIGGAARSTVRLTRSN